MIYSELKNLISNKNIAAGIAAAALVLAAIILFPYGYYILLRWIVAVSSVFTAYVASQLNRIGWMWLFVLVALLFNPIAPVYLDRETWQIIDFVAAGLFVSSIFFMKGSQVKHV